MSKPAIRFPDLDTDVFQIKSALFMGSMDPNHVYVVCDDPKDGPYPCQTIRDLEDSTSGSGKTFSRVTLLEGYSNSAFYLFAIADCYSPPCYIIPGDCVGDAYEIFIDYASEHLGIRIDPSEYRDYIPSHYLEQYDNLDFEDFEGREKMFSNYGTHEIDSSGNPVHTENVFYRHVRLVSATFNDTSKG